jgi:DNA-binding protein YbaB
MKKVTLQEQINRSLKMMGLINEATSGSANFIGTILSKLAKNEKDVFFKAIENKIGAALPQKGLNNILNLVNTNKITKKEVLQILVDVFKQAKKDVGLFSNFIKEGAPNFFSDLQDLIKGNVSKTDIKGVLPELEDLPEEIFEDLLIKAGFKEATEEVIDSMARSMSSTFPFLFKEKGWWFFKELLNEQRINEAIEQLSKDFTGKNADGMSTIVNKKLADLEIDIKASNLQPEDIARSKKMFAWMRKNLNPIVYKQVNGKTVVDNTKTMKSILGKSAIAGTAVAGTIIVSIFIELLVDWKRNNTGSKFKDLLLAFDQQFGGTIDVVTRKTYVNDDIRSFIQFLVDTFGDDGWGNKEKYTISYVGQSDVIMVTDKENVSKYFIYDNTNRVYVESDSAGKPLR